MKICFCKDEVYDQEYKNHLDPLKIFYKYGNNILVKMMEYSCKYCNEIFIDIKIKNVYRDSIICSFCSQEIIEKVKNLEFKNKCLSIQNHPEIQKHQL